MSRNPRVQSKAQQEIDMLIGDDRAPELKDLENLPYVRAIINELHRYRPIAPTGIPHSTTAETMVGGYRIPKGTILLLNSWGIGRDEELFDAPDRFLPERFILSEFGTKPDADTVGCREIPFSFGIGRRICPGLHLTNNTIALTVLQFLWAFNINLLKGSNTVLSTPIPTGIDAEDTTDGLLLTPKPFTCDIKPRKPKLESSNSSWKRRELFLTSWIRYEWRDWTMWWAHLSLYHVPRA